MDKNDKEADKGVTKLGLAELRQRLGMKPDAAFKLNAILVNKILEGPPVAALIPFGDNLYLQHDRLPKRGRAKAKGRWYRRYHPVVDGERVERREPLGNTDDLSPAQAKDKNDEVRLKLRANIDPRAEREAAKAQRQTEKKQAVTLAMCWAPEGKGVPPDGMSRRQWAIALQASWRKGGARHGTSIESYHDSIAAAQLSFNGFQRYLAIWQNHIEPTIGHIPIVDLTAVDVARAVGPHWNTPYRGETLRWQIWDMIEYARTAKGVLIASNPAWMPSASRTDGRRRQVGRDALTRLLGHKDPHVKKHFAALPVPEVPRFYARLRATPQAWNWLRLHPGLPDRRMLAAELCILLGGRDTAVCAAKYSQVQYHTKGLEIRHRPGKGGIEVQPCSQRAWEIITTCAAEDGVDLTAPSSKRNVPIFFKKGVASEEFGGGRHWDIYLKRITVGASPPFPHFTLHGFRSCLDDWAHANGFDNELSEWLLMHRTKSATQKAYYRDKRYEERRAAFEAWAQYCAREQLPPGIVINMDKQHTKLVDDTELLEEIHEILTSGQAPNLWAATALVAERADGRGALNGKRQRLRVKYRETYGYHDRDQRPLCQNDDLPLIDEMHVLLTNGEVRSLWAATDRVADRAKGIGKRVNTRDRLYRRYEEIYGKAEKYKFRGYLEADTPEEDALLVAEMHRLLTVGEARSRAAAALEVADRAQGTDSLPALQWRLVRHFQDTYGDQFKFDMAAADAPLVQEMREMVRTGKAAGPWPAALLLAHRAAGDANLNSKRQRLYRYYNDAYRRKLNRGRSP
jgi:hypothetical protein